MEVPERFREAGLGSPGGEAVSKPYLLPDRKSIAEITRQEAESGIVRVRGQLKELESKMFHRSHCRNASAQDVRADKAQHADLTEIYNKFKTKLENLGVEIK